MKSGYQLFKLWWVTVLPLAKDAIHVYIGFLCLVFALVVLRRRLTSLWALLPGILLSLAMEYFDLRDGFGWRESLKDIINTNLIPLLLILLARWRAIQM